MVTFIHKRMTGRRIISGFLSLIFALLISGCTTQTKRLDGDAGVVRGRPFAVLNNPVRPMHRDTNSIVGLGLANSLVDTALKAASGIYEKTAQIALPSIDPTQIVEEKLLASITVVGRAKSVLSLL